MQNTISGGDQTTAVETGWDDSIEVTATSHVEEPAEPLPEAEPAPQPTDENDGEDDAEGDEPKEQSKRRPKGYVKKLYQREAELEQERTRVKELQQELERLRNPAKQTEAPKSDESDEPQPDQFNTFAEYLAAQRKYDRDLGAKEAQKAVEKALELRESKAKEAQFTQSIQTKAVDIDKAILAREAENPGISERFQETIDAGLFTMPLVALLTQSPASAELTEYLVDTPQELAALSQMNPVQLSQKLARLEGLLEGRKSAPEAPKRQTKASAPINPVTSPKAKSASPTDFNDMSQEDFDALMRT